MASGARVNSRLAFLPIQYKKPGVITLPLAFCILRQNVVSCFSAHTLSAASSIPFPLTSVRSHPS